MDAQELTAWTGRCETAQDIVTAAPVRALRATLDLPLEPVPDGMPLPPLWHWLYFLPLHRQSELGDDGHARRGGFLPPVPLPRRMWAGSAFEFHDCLRVGDAVERRSTIESVTPKAGRSGALVFVRVRHELRRDGAANAAIVEWHDIVYREALPRGAPKRPRAPREAQWRRSVKADERLLFRYSALTFNGHRIHYDRGYATGAEGYPGLVVHGPLVATLMLELLREHLPQARLVSFGFKALQPLFDLAAFAVCGRRDAGAVELWAEDHAGGLAFDASATLV